MTALTPEPWTIKRSLPCPGLHSNVVPSVKIYAFGGYYALHGVYVNVGLLCAGAPRYIRGYPIVVRSPHIITGGTVVAPQPKGHRWGGACQLTYEEESQRVPRVSVPKQWPQRGNKATRKLLCLGGGVAWAPGEGGGGGFQKWASMPGPLFRVPPKAPEHKFWPGKVFFTKKVSPTYV